MKIVLIKQLNFQLLVNFDPFFWVSVLWFLMLCKRPAVHTSDNPEPGRMWQTEEPGERTKMQLKVPGTWRKANGR